MKTKQLLFMLIFCLLLHYSYSSDLSIGLRGELGLLGPEWIVPPNWDTPVSEVKFNPGIGIDIGGYFGEKIGYFIDIVAVKNPYYGLFLGLNTGLGFRPYADDNMRLEMGVGVFISYLYVSAAVGPSAYMGMDYRLSSSLFLTTRLNLNWYLIEGIWTELPRNGPWDGFRIPYRNGFFMSVALSPVIGFRFAL